MMAYSPIVKFKWITGLLFLIVVSGVSDFSHATQSCPGSFDSRYREIVPTDVAIATQEKHEYLLDPKKNQKIHKLLAELYTSLIYEVKNSYFQMPTTKRERIADQVRATVEISPPLPFFTRVMDELYRRNVEEREILEFVDERSALYPNGFWAPDNSRVETEYLDFLKRGVHNITTRLLLIPQVGEKEAQELHRSYRNTVLPNPRLLRTHTDELQLRGGSVGPHFSNYASRLPRRFVSFDGSRQNPLRPIEAFFLSTQFPITKQGSDFIRRIAIATHIFYEIVLQSTTHSAGQIMQEGNARNLILEQTARGRDEVRYKDIQLPSPTRATLEGVKTLAQALVLLTVENIPGMTPNQLVRSILIPSKGETESLMQKFTHRLRMGSIGPLFFAGAYYPKPLILKDGKLDFSQTMKETLLVQAKDATETLRDNTWRMEGFPCPISNLVEGFHQTGIDMISEVFWDIYERVELN